MRAAEPTEAETEFFEKAVRPLLVEKCRMPRRSKAEGPVQADLAGEALQGGDNGVAIVPGKPDESLLIKAVRYQDKPRCRQRENSPTGRSRFSKRG